MNPESSSKVVGHPNQSGWSLVHDFTPTPELVKTHGRLVAVVSMSKVNALPQTNEEITVGREVLRHLHEEYFGKKGNSPLDALKYAVEKVTKEFSLQNQTLSLLAASFIGNTLFVVGKGDVSSFILRQGSLAQILKSETSKLVSASGRLKGGDTLLFTTNNLFNVASLDTLKTSLSNSNQNSFSEVFAPLIHAKESLSNLGSITLTIKSAPGLEKVEVSAPKINTYKEAVQKPLQ